ncbi:FHA domain-containing protein [Tabrizicola sp.]|uniref:FHA domain-containing protein n=1 Tax=Tabrizicola sp. TaxID=2005166 RepID=UPI002FDE84F3
MAALAELEVKRLREALAAAAPAPAPEPEQEPAPDMPVARPHRVVKQKAPLPEGVSAPARSIWDIEDETPKPELAATPAETEPMPRRPTRTKTRVLGFEAQPAAVVPLFEGIEGAPVLSVTPAAGKGYVMFPAGWLVVKDGPGKGASYALTQGVSQIGRSSDQTVALDFGDMAISRQNHAAIAYDAATHQFHIGHGGKSNLVRLNGRPLLATETAGDGDEIQIGETTLVLKVLCTPDFNWSTFEAEGDGHDMAIA